jgi:uncharacterized protein
VITIRGKHLSSFTETARGLMFQKKITPVYFETKFGVHTFFVKYPIDVVILDAGGIIQKMRPGLKPFRLFFWNPKWHRVLELPHNTIRHKHLKVGTKISVQEMV